MYLLYPPILDELPTTLSSLVYRPSTPTFTLSPSKAASRMGMSYRRYLSGARIYGCSSCRTHLATIHSMISRVRPPVPPLPAAPLSVHGMLTRSRLFDRRSTDSMEGHTSLTGCEYIPHVYCSWHELTMPHVRPFPLPHELWHPEITFLWERLVGRYAPCCASSHRPTHSIPTTLIPQCECGRG